MQKVSSKDNGFQTHIHRRSSLETRVMRDFK